MDGNVKVEDPLEVSLATTSDPTCSISHLSKVEHEWFRADFNTKVKHEDLSIQGSDYQIKLEVPDTNFGTISGSNNYMKLEPLESEELQIKDEINQSPTGHTLKKNIHIEYICCDLCIRKFTHKKNLRRHMKIHTGEKPFKCSICDYGCIQKRCLSDHIKTHTNDKPYKCSICNYRCIQKVHLSNHIKTHTGEKPFKCSLCDFKCIQKYELSRHFKTHTGEKPFNCCICDYRCIKKSNLSQHIKTHTGEKPFKCDECNYRCLEKRSLKRHMKTHF